MKRTAFFITMLALFISLSILTGCGQSEPDIWDGTVADSFIYGAGTESDPYKITSAAELAYLSKSVNSGNDYDGEYFVLDRDIDLASLEWSPIGDGVNAFSGYFNGSGHTISNLNITNAIEYDKEYTFGVSHQGVSGLFGYCFNASICSLNIDSSTITVDNTSYFDMLYIGTLSGRYEASKNSELSDIHIDDASIKLTTTKGMTLTSGGVAGYVHSIKSANIIIDKIQADVIIDVNNSSEDTPYGIINSYMGGIVGMLYSDSNIECNNIANYMTALFTENRKSIIGAFGSTQVSSQHSSEIKLDSIFSEVKVNRIFIVSPDIERFFSVGYKSHAIIGELFHGKNADGTCSSGGYEFKNLYGCVKPADSDSGFTSPYGKLYSLQSHVIYSETNCIGCEALPENCGFDADIWNLSDRSKPILK